MYILANYSAPAYDCHMQNPESTFSFSDSEYPPRVLAMVLMVAGSSHLISLNAICRKDLFGPMWGYLGR